ncbi:MAG: polyphosphate polymerase domain-containing protein [Gammaproteobacteria bacterium]|nr:polyphosphate polymerase domain-containing protein [Gammaproteobacteria bacterium]
MDGSAEAQRARRTGLAAAGPDGTSSGQTAASPSWQRVLAGFETVTLDQIADTALSDRIDTKFVMSQADVFAVLESLAADYRVLDIDGLRFTGYRTQYFDTEDFALFRRHHAAGSHRYKVRTRTYLNTQQSFIEVKSKTKADATVKVRQRIPAFQTEITGDSAAFVDEHFPPGSSVLRPALLNGFDRISLLGNGVPERLTIDLDIATSTNDTVVPLPNVAVAELKQQRRGGHRRESQFLKHMRSMNIRATGFSKYCMCLLMTRRDLKHNRFKPQLRRLERLMGEPHAD